jgi:hypothetical protein
MFRCLKWKESEGPTNEGQLFFRGRGVTFDRSEIRTLLLEHVSSTLTMRLYLISRHNLHRSMQPILGFDF